MKRERGDCNIALLNACKSGTFEEVCAALDGGASENAVEEKTGTSALMFACSRGPLCKIPFTLLKCGALCNVQNADGNFALHYAAQFSSAEIVALIVASWPHAVNMKNKEGEDSLSRCIYRKDVDGPRIIEILAEHGAELDRREPYGYTIMHDACLDGTYDMVCAIAKHYPTSCHLSTKDGEIPFMYACQNKEHGPKIMEFLISKGVDATICDNYATCKGSAVTYAIYGSPAILKQLSKYIPSSDELSGIYYDEYNHGSDPLGFTREGARYGFKFRKSDFSRYVESEDPITWAILRAGPLRWETLKTSDVFKAMITSDSPKLWLTAVRELGGHRHIGTGDTLLHLAARSNKMFAVQILMRRRLNPFIQNNKHLRPIDETTDPAIQNCLLQYHRFKMERAHLDWLGPYFENSAVLFMWVVKKCTPTLTRDVCTLILEQLRRKMYA